MDCRPDRCRLARAARIQAITAGERLRSGRDERPLLGSGRARFCTPVDESDEGYGEEVRTENSTEINSSFVAPPSSSFYSARRQARSRTVEAEADVRMQEMKGLT
jgi:hypothetical protein